MASVASPYGLRPAAMVGGQAMVHGLREIKLSTNNSAAIFTGDVIQLSSAGNPQSLAVTPTTATAGVVGVCAGVRYSVPAASGGMVQHGQFLPANAITNLSYTNIWVLVYDDPDMLFQVQGSAAFGSLANGADGAIGKNAALGNFGGSTTTGLSTVNLVVGANGTSLASTNTLAVRVVDYVSPGETDSFPELIVKFNHGVHSYYAPLGV